MRVYITIIHCMLIASLAFNCLYFSDQYEIVKIAKLQQAEQAQEEANNTTGTDYAMILARSGAESKKDIFSVLNKPKAKK